MPVLNWIGKDKIVDHDKELPFRVLKPNKKLSVGEESENLLIQGDNLEALKALMPFYHGKVKCIYIDPPYNTGNEGWIYNDRVNAPQIKQWLNKVVGGEGEDLCRHDKWLCMMYPRLKLLRDLLSEDGAIFISLDDNEQHHLRILLDEIFHERNFVANIIWQKKYSPQNDAKYFSDMHDFILVYAKNKTIWRPNALTRTETQDAAYKNPDDDPRGRWKATDATSNKSKHQRPNLYYSVVNPHTGEEVWPSEIRVWRYSKDVFEKAQQENRVWWGKSGKNKVPAFKSFLTEVKQGRVPSTIWPYEEVGHNQSAKQELNLFFENNSFETPKPTTLMKRIIELSCDENSIILDSFAGSGTMGQAVLEMNKEDGGARKFILVELEKHIAEGVTAPRLTKTINGLKGVKHSEGTGQGFQYLDLNGELFSKDGFVNESAAYEDLASYIFYVETRSYTELSSIKPPFIGKMGSTTYYLIFEKQGNNVLESKFFEELKNVSGSKVVFADKTLIDEEDLQKHSVIFKQIPYELKKF
jgi:adenine-specific DNA-methyltransferase